MGKKIWICGHVQIGKQWDFVGVFTTEKRALKACKNKEYFIAPAKLNEELADQVEFPGYFPLHSDEKRGPKK